jgi:hypothetical protein
MTTTAKILSVVEAWEQSESKKLLSHKYRNDPLRKHAARHGAACVFGFAKQIRAAIGVPRLQPDLPLKPLF